MTWSKSGSQIAGAGVWRQDCPKMSIVCNLFTAQSHIELVDGVEALFRHVKHVEGNVDLVAQVILQSLKGHIKLALGWVPLQTSTTQGLSVH